MKTFDKLKNKTQLQQKNIQITRRSDPNINYEDFKYFNNKANYRTAGKIISKTQELDNIIHLSEKGREAIYLTYISVCNKLPRQNKRSVYFSTKFAIIMSIAFRTNNYLREKYIIEYKDMLKLLTKIGISKNNRKNNHAFELVDFDYRKYKYNMEEYIKLFWNTILYSDAFINHLDELNFQVYEYKILLYDFYKSIKERYLNNQEFVHTGGMYSFIMNLFIYYYHNITSYLAKTNPSVSSILDETNLRKLICQIVYDNRLLITEKKSIINRIYRNPKFEKLKDMIFRNDDLLQKTLKVSFQMVDQSIEKRKSIDTLSNPLEIQ